MTRQADNHELGRQKFEFTAEAKGLRLDQFIALRFPALSLTRIRKAVREGAVRVNGRNSFQGWILQAGDRVTIEIDPGEPTAALPEDIPLDILFEDDDLIVVNKPVGLLSHPSRTEKSGTLMNAIAHHILHGSHRPGKAVSRPVLLHRLDRDTSGVLAIARNERASRIVTRAFRMRRVRKSYLALVGGVVAAEGGEIDAPIGRSPHDWPRWQVMDTGDPSQTRFTVRERFAGHTLLELEPLTGRTHQLRIHCAYIGHPVVGDQVYKGQGAAPAPGIPGLKLKHQLLHAQSLSFRHPTTGEEMTFNAPLPPAMTKALERLRNH
ncbi:MAG TPA: RluA family pseudouridine synthase [Blastocatellia bacterium]|nr:RluA family pseudouridine synthase [Blastocatellia bacterium]